MSAYAESAATTCFSVRAEAEASVMLRVMEEFAKRSLMPLRWYSSLDGRQSEELYIDIQVRDLSPALTERLAAVLRQQLRVRTVLTSVKTDAEVA